MKALELALLNDFQHGFPLDPEPYRKIAARLGVPEGIVLGTLERLVRRGAVSRVGAVFSPRRVGASTLAAMAVPETKLKAVAQSVSTHPGVNHNYAREHRYNLWFVATAPEENALEALLARIEAEAGYPLLRLPLVEDYHIDLGFDLLYRAQRGGRNLTRPADVIPPPSLGPQDRTLIAALQEGLPLASRPYAELGKRAGMEEPQVIAALERWLDSGVLRRLGVIVRHHELGYTANAMVIWDVPDAEVAAVGRRVAEAGIVTLCYRRERALPHWPYNLYCMIHGKVRENVLSRVEALRVGCALESYAYEVLFSRERFKQCGARYA